jgi:hypothetical protein
MVSADYAFTGNPIQQRKYNGIVPKWFLDDLIALSTHRILRQKAAEPVGLQSVSGEI